MAPAIANLIGGRSESPANDTMFVSVHNPSTGEVIGEVPLCGAAEVDAAVEAATVAFASWSATPAPRRAACLFRYRELLEQNFEALARLITRENGKTFEEASGESQQGEGSRSSTLNRFNGTRCAVGRIPGEFGM